MTEPRIIRSSRGEGQRGYDLWAPADGVDDLYVDGFAGMAITGSVLRVGLFINSLEPPSKDAEEGIEHRIMKTSLTMPIENFVEMCQQVLGNISGARDQLETGLKERTEKLLSISAPRGSVIATAPLEESEKADG